MTFDAVTGILTPVAILAFVNILKDSGLPTRLAAPIAVTLGGLLHLAGWAWVGTGWWEALSAGIVAGLSASGFYDVARATVEPKRAKIEVEKQGTPS